MGNSRNQQFICFKSCTILGSVMKSHAVLLHFTLTRPGRDSSIWSSYPRCTRYSPVSHSAAFIRLPVMICSAWVLITLILLTNGPKCKVVMLAIQRCQREAIKYKYVNIWGGGKHSIYRVGTTCGFRNPLGVLEYIPHRYGGQMELLYFNGWRARSTVWSLNYQYWSLWYLFGISYLSGTQNTCWWDEKSRQETVALTFSLPV